MAMHLLDKSLDDSSIGSLIIQRKIKIKTLLYKFSFETTMTTVMYLRPYIPNCSIFTISGWNEFPCCIRNYSYLLFK